jgi:hypothetical protein
VPRTVFYFPGTLALLLRADSWLSEHAITSGLRNYGRSGQQFWVKSRRPGSHHYYVRPAAGGFYVTAGPLSALTRHTPLTSR